jgi:predicted nucleotidyltransferase
MPVKSSRSPVIKWPDAGTVDRAVRRWAHEVTRNHEGVRRIGYFGSYARGDWGVGSDLDLIIIVAQSDAPFERRSVAWDTTGLPVPADVLVYTEAEWEAIDRRARFYRTITNEAVWAYPKES